VKVLALVPRRRLHREQVLDLLWPGDTVVEALPQLQSCPLRA
jgi:DNA-binding SARP family transcriptional activator